MNSMLRNSYLAVPVGRRPVILAVLALSLWLFMPALSAMATTGSKKTGKIQVATIVLKNNEGTVEGKVLAYKMGEYVKVEDKKGEQITVLHLNILTITFRSMDATAWENTKAPPIELPDDDDNPKVKKPGKPPVVPPGKNPPSTVAPKPKDPEKKTDPGAKTPPTPTKPKKTGVDIELPDEDDKTTHGTKPKTTTADEAFDDDDGKVDRVFKVVKPKVLTKEEKALLKVKPLWKNYTDHRLIFKGGVFLGLSLDSGFNNSLGGCSQETLFNGIFSLGLEWDGAITVPADSTSNPWNSFYASISAGFGALFIDERIRSCNDCSEACGQEINDNYGFQLSMVNINIAAGMRFGWGHLNPALNAWDGWRIGIGLTANSSVLGFHVFGFRVDLDFITNDITKEDREFFWRYSISYYPSIADMPQYFIAGVEILWF
ncbi:hypothetical protein KKF84_18570 [Myxococcota bacterium]|nr:hypothetical protein [Myxococcota bacterium]MBU1537326.1 hypothetical protein [Myxococcota bacterium]